MLHHENCKGVLHCVFCVGVLTRDMTMDQKQQRNENISFQHFVCTASVMLMWLMCELCPLTSSMSSSFRTVTLPTLETLWLSPSVRHVLLHHTCSIDDCSKLQSMSDISYSVLLPVMCNPSQAHNRNCGAVRLRTWLLKNERSNAEA